MTDLTAVGQRHRVVLTGVLLRPASVAEVEALIRGSGLVAFGGEWTIEVEPVDQHITTSEAVDRA